MSLVSTGGADSNLTQLETKVDTTLDWKPTSVIPNDYKELLVILKYPNGANSSIRVSQIIPKFIIDDMRIETTTYSDTYVFGCGNLSSNNNMTLGVNICRKGDGLFLVRMYQGATVIKSEEMIDTFYYR